MLPIVYYFLQVILCSGIMMGYYWLVLRNKRFHQYNRFFLLGVALLSWIIPLIKISWGHATAENDPQMIRFLSIVADNNTQFESSFIHKGFMLNWTMLATVSYISVSLLLLVGMIRAFVRIFQLLKVHSCKTMGDIYLILTQAKGTPFSFFRYIFWNEDIDIRSEAGKQIMAHELTHVRQKHSFDKIYMQLILIAGWLNPFFWLIKREMDMIHEFIADHKAVVNGDAATLAQMILSAAYPKQQFALTNPFFFSPIKRRLRMLSNNRYPRFTYIRRLVVLPLLAIVVVLFAFRKKEDRMNATISVGSVVRNVVSDVIRVGNGNSQNAISTFNEARLDRNYTVLIDAGHGGPDKGVIAQDGTDESVLNLQLATKIADLNQNKNIRIILSRTSDVNQDWAAKESLISQKEPDLIVSLHVGSSSPQKISSGMVLYVPSDIHASNYKGSEALANYLSKSLQPIQESMPAIKRRSLKDIKILEKVAAPSVLLSTGYINIAEDLDKLKNPEYQQQLAGSILQGINDFLSKPAQTSLNLAKMGMDTIILKQNGSENIIKLNYTPEKSVMGKALIVLDGNVISEELMNLIDPNKIESVDVLKGESAIIAYGERAKNGVVSIKTKKEATNATTNYRPLFPTSVRAVPHANIRKGYPIQDVDSGRLKKQEDSSLIINNPDGSSPLVLVNGKRTSLKYLSPYKIKSVNVLKDQISLKKYGEEGKNGVVEIETFSDESSGKDEKETPTKKNTSLNLFSEAGKNGEGEAKQDVDMIAFQKKLKDAMKGNSKTFFNIDGQSCVVTGSGSSASFVGDVAWVIVNGKKISTEELNRDHSRNEFVMVAANDTKKILQKYGKGLLLVSNKGLSNTEVSALMN